MKRHDRTIRSGSIRLKLVGILFVLLACGAVAWFAVIKSRGASSGSDAGEFAPLPESVSSNAPDMATALGISPNQLKSEAELEAAQPLSKTFSDQSLHMSFRYPAAFAVREIPDHSATIVTVVDMKTGVGLQIQVSPFSGQDQNLTPDMVKTDIPDFPMKDPQTLSLAPGHKAATFIGEQGSQTTRELWFINRGYLYQFSAPIESEAVLKAIFNTFKSI